MIIEHNPIKKLVISQIVKLPIEEYIQQCVTPDHSLSLWCDGKLLAFWRDDTFYPMLQEKYQKGIIYWSMLMYTDCPEKLKSLSRKDTKFEMNVIDATFNTIFKDVVNYLKKREELGVVET